MKLRIRCKQVKKFTHTLPLADNLLKQKFKAETPNTIWVSNITYIPTDESWLSCAAHKDLFDGEIAGYALGSRIIKELAITSLLMAVKRKLRERELITHITKRAQDLP
ncbi:MAG: hypothetical protein A4E62_01801 [Syntrophorhabdus sp. PtaU1.Bin002]|nr:MAG: hypothetical protein A4E62_01801 [Syntrophorhabdus sp. PtaU1.Bin002]